MNLRTVLVCVAKFHHFDLARQLERHGALERIYTGYPMFKLREEGVPFDKIVSKPLWQSLYMRRGALRLTGRGPTKFIAWQAHEAVDKAAARSLPECDVLFGLSGSALRAGLRAKERGAKYVCDRGSSHIRFQDAILREEHEMHGVPYEGIEPRVLERHDQEYAAADAITVPSRYTLRTFLERGTPADKMRQVPYGTNLERFQQVGEPDPERFDVLFVGQLSLRKGLPYLFQAFEKLKHPRKSLRVVGGEMPETKAVLDRYAKAEGIEIVGPMPQAKLKELMSQSHVMVLPSVEEGLALVQAQAMACGCPVIGSAHSGLVDLAVDGESGFVVPIRDPRAITERLQELADDPNKRATMGAAAKLKVQGMGGWDAYGDAMYEMLKELVR